MTIVPSSGDYVRGDQILAYISVDALINRMRTIIVKLPQGWCVVAASPEHDEVFTDLGPFPTPELAAVTLRIAQD